MRKMASILLLLGLAAVAMGQVANFPQTLPSSTVIGRLGTGPGPAEAIPFATLAPELFATVGTPGTTGLPLVSTGGGVTPQVLTVAGGGTGDTSFTQDLPLIGNGTNPIAQGTKSGNTNKFITTTGVLTTNDCIKVDANGNFVDAGSTCSSGVAQATSQNFLATTHFTPGSTTQLTLSASPASSASLMLAFDGVVQSHNTWSLSGAVITFSAAIPTNVQVVEAQWTSASTQGGVGSIGTLNGAVLCGNALDCGTGVGSTLSVVTPPGGRLTLQSGTAFPTDPSGLTAKSTIYYSCTGQHAPYVPVPNGTSLDSLPIPSCEISTGLSSSFVSLNNGYDLFVVKSAGIAKLCYGNHNWTTGSQTGTTVTHGSFNFHNTLGYWTNSSTITNCYSGGAGTTDLGPVTADHALYVGSFLASANGQTSHAPTPTRALGGTNTWCGLYNAYNRRRISCRNKDSTSGWNTTWASGASVPCDAAATGVGLNNRINWIDGLGHDWWDASLKFSVAPISTLSNYATTVELGLDSTSVVQEVAEEQVGAGTAATANDGRVIRVDLSKQPTIGKHFLQCLENGGNTFYFGNDFMHFWLNVWM